MLANVRQVGPEVTAEMVARAFARYHGETEEDAAPELTPDPYHYGAGRE